MRGRRRRAGLVAAVAAGLVVTGRPGLDMVPVQPVLTGAWVER